MSIPFTKMHGAGNDFVIIDLRRSELEFNTQHFVRIADRHKGIGCDQIVLIQNQQNGADIRLRFFNANGSESKACGNGARCAASKIMADNGRDFLSIETQGKILTASRDINGLVTIDMGQPETEWWKIPLAKNMDTLNLDLTINELSKPVAVGLGNPHCVFFVKDADTIDVEHVGSIVEMNELFPEKTNVEFISQLSDCQLRMRVWERGVGVTLACGSGACAAVVAAIRRKLLRSRSAKVIADGGTLSANWREDGHVLLSGPTVVTFQGALKSEVN